MVRASAWFLVIILLTAGCLDEPDCFHLNNSWIGISFKKIENSTADTVAFTGYGTVEPPILFSLDTTISKLVLPLNYFANETTFFFETPDSVQVLRLGYVSQAQFVSENCGEKFVLTGLKVLGHNFDSVRLVVDIPTADGNATNIEIFQ